MKKILLAGGCSMTDPNYISGVHPEMDCSWPKWPELLAKKLDMDSINLGTCGAGNEYIYSSLLEKILKKKDQIGLVMVGWTQCQRKDFQVRHLGHWKQKRFDPDGDVFGWLIKTLRYMISLQLVCENYNIPYKQFQMINLFEGWLNGLYKTDEELFTNRNDPNYEFQYRYPGDRDKDRPKLQKILMDYEPYINAKNFIGWPTHLALGGYDIEQKVIRLPRKKQEKLWNIIITSKEKERELIEKGSEFQHELIISERDQHPNEKGQQKIAEFLYDRLG